MTSSFQHGAYGGYGAFGALGATDFVEGTDFKCEDKAGNPLPICFGIGAQNHALLQQLQQVVNAFSTEKGFAPLDVDGFIGDLTVAAVARLGSVFAEVGAPFHPGNVTKADVAVGAPSIIEALKSAITRRLAAGQQVAAQGTPVAPTKQTASAAGVSRGAAADITAITTAPTAAAAAALPAKKSFLPLILGGLAAVLVVGGVGYVVYRRKARGA
jgi:lysozyme family protein